MYAILSQLVQPFTFMVMLFVLAVICLWRSRKLSRRWLALLTVLAVGLFIVSLPAFTYVVQGPLESNYPPTRYRPDGAEAIVVLSGGIYAPDDIRPKAVLSDETVARCVRAAEMFRDGEPCPVLLTGGKVDPTREGPSLSQAMYDFMSWQLGLDKQYLIREERSQTTYENAVETAKWLKRHDIKTVILVSTVSHLNRAENCFKSQGIEVIPVGCGYRATQVPTKLIDYIPDARAAAINQAAIHEWLGMFWYRCLGRD